MRDERVAAALGWFSVGLGLTEAVATRHLSRFLGLEGRASVVRVFGLREIATGVGVLSQRNLPLGLWARVVGDALDLAMLGSALSSAQGKRGRVIGALAMVGAITALDVAYARRLSESRRGNKASAASAAQERSITVGKPADALYRLWHDPAAIAQIMGSVAEVTPAGGDGRLCWVAHAPLGLDLRWETETVEDRAGESLHWRSLPGAAVFNEGLVRFRPAPGDWGTEVTLRILLATPGGEALSKIADGASKLVLGQVLHRFKSLAETGEIPTLAGQPAAREGGRDD
jgi:uncharacterized membrane protein